MGNGRRTVLVTGATGTQGGAVARELMRRGYEVRAFTRDPGSAPARKLEAEGATLTEGDMRDVSSLDRAMRDVWGVFSVQNFWEAGYEGEIEQGRNVAEVARRAGVGHLVYSSVGSAWAGTGLPHFESKWQVEQHIRSLGLPNTILRPVFFMENFEGMRPMILGGELAFPLSPETRLQMVSVRDIGVFAAMAFDEPAEFRDRSIGLAGDELPMRRVAEILTDVVGTRVSYVTVEWSTFREQMGAELEAMMRWFEDVGYEADVPSLRRLHPDLRSFPDYAGDAFGTHS